MSPSSALDSVRAEIARLARGRRRLRGVRVALRALFYGWVAVAIAAWFLSPQQVLVGAAAVVALAALGGAIAAAWVPVNPVTVAKRYDDQVGIKDLVSTSLQLGDDSSRFADAVREDAAHSTGRAAMRTLYPLRAPLEARWLPAPLAAGALALVVPLLLREPEAPPDPRVPAVLQEMAGRIDSLLERWADRANELANPAVLTNLEAFAAKLREPDMDQRRSLAELARLASQLDKEHAERDSERMLLEKNSAKLARGEELKDARRDMEGGRFREAANQVRKKIAELEQQRKEAVEKKAQKLEIEKLEKAIEQLKNLLAELEELHALGNQMKLFSETLEVLDRIEGALGELGEFDGMEFERAMLGRLQPGERSDHDAERLLVSPSNIAGFGHVKQVLGGARRALGERAEVEAKLREGPGKSQFGQIQTANDGSRSRTAYGDAVLAAKRAAEDAIYRQNIPAGYRRYIRGYFETLQPDERDPAKGR